MDALLTFLNHEFHRGKEFNPMPTQRKPEVFTYSHVEKKQKNTIEEKHNVSSNCLVKTFQSNLNQNGDVSNLFLAKISSLLDKRSTLWVYPYY